MDIWPLSLAEAHARERDGKVNGLLQKPQPLPSLAMEVSDLGGFDHALLIGEVLSLAFFQCTQPLFEA